MQTRAKPQASAPKSQFDSDDYYVVLGISRDADEAAIKKAYRVLAIKWHPVSIKTNLTLVQDKNPDNLAEAEETFKKIGEAYSVLSDPEKRRVFDKYGKKGMQTGGGQGDFGGFSSSGFTARNADDIFKAFFGGRDPFADFFTDDDFFSRGFGGQRQEQRQPKKAQQKGGFGFGGGFGGGFFEDDDDDFFGRGFGGSSMF